MADDTRLQLWLIYEGSTLCAKTISTSRSVPMIFYGLCFLNGISNLLHDPK